MADHSKPTNASAYTDYTTQINARVDDALRGLDPARTTATNMPQYSVRWSSASKKWEIWSGTAWGDLAAEYAISISGAAGKLKTARTIALSGGATGTATAFDGSANITIPITALAWASITGAPAFATRWPAWGEVTSKPTFGTAATKNVTTSSTDSTAASILKVGDFGIGAKSAAPIATNADDWLMPNGIYQVGAGTAGTLPEPYGSVIVCGSPDQTSTGNWAQQIFLSTTGVAYYRNSTNLNAWAAWKAVGLGGQLSKTGSATFTRLSNNIALTGIVAALGLEVGDVIQITDTASNNFTMTVEVITDANDINVNYAHRNGAGPLSLTDETVTCTIKRIAKWYNAPLGLGQAWLSTARAGSTTFTNSTKRSIVFSATAGQIANAASRFWISINGLIVSTSGGSTGGQSVGVSAVVPPGGAYLYATDTGSSLGGYQTYELR